MEKSKGEFWGLIGTNLAVIAMVVALFTWNRSEARSDYRAMDAKMDQNREMIIAIHTEMQDFHGRLCALEEKYHQIERR